MTETTSKQKVERVTVETHKAKNVRKVEAGCTSAAAKKAKQERLLKDLHVAKESIQMCEAMSSTEPERSEDVNRASKKHVTQKEESWTQWILGASSLVVVFLFQHFEAQISHAKAAQQAGAQKKQAVSKIPKQLNVDPFYME